MRGVIFRFIVAVAFIAAGALAFRTMHAPLPYILGPLVGAAIYSNIFSPIAHDQPAKRIGILLLGTAVSGTLTRDLLIEFVHLMPVILLITVCTNLLSIALAVPTAWIARVDRLTALLSCMPAGMAEMATLARDLGGKEHVVTTVHTLRLIMIMIVISVWLGARNPIQGVLPTLSLLEHAGLAAFILTSAALAFAAARLGLSASWIIVPIVAGVAVVAGGSYVPPLPQPLIVAAQIAIGAALGNSFDLRAMRTLPRTVLAGLLSGTILIGTCFSAFAGLVSIASDLPYSTAVLSVAPGGFGEMLAAAKSMGVTSATVAGFHIARTLLINSLAPPIIRLIWGGKPPRS